MQVHCFTCREDLEVVGDLASHTEHHLEVMGPNIITRWDKPETYFYLVWAVFGGVTLVLIIKWFIQTLF